MSNRNPDRLGHRDDTDGAEPSPAPDKGADVRALFDRPARTEEAEREENLAIGARVAESLATDPEILSHNLAYLRGEEARLRGDEEALTRQLTELGVFPTPEEASRQILESLRGALDEEDFRELRGRDADLHQADTPADWRWAFT